MIAALVRLMDLKRWMVRGEPPTRPGFTYQPRFFWFKYQAEAFAHQLRRDGCYVPEPTRSGKGRP